jgi:hypothetical protein
MTLARRATLFSPMARVVPGALSLPKHSVDASAPSDATEVQADSSVEAARVLRLDESRITRDGE